MIKLIKSTFFDEAATKEKLARFILDENFFSMGTQCLEFEKAFAAKQGRKHAVYVGNGSVANLLLIQSMINLGHLKRGDKVGFSALTWPTNVMPLIQLGLIPVPIDCELSNLNVSPAKLTPIIDQIRALFITNVLGFCDDLPKIREVCSESGVILMEDNCESLGSVIGGTMLGNFGIAATFSFFVGHHMSTIEGGMVVTDDDDLHDSLVMGRAHGWDRNLSSQSQNKLRSEAGVDSFYAKYTFYDLASNFRPTEINGFLGNTQISFWEEIVRRRAENFSEFLEALDGNDDFYPMDLTHMDLVSNFAMPVIAKTAELAEAYKSRFIQSDVEIRPIIAGNIARQPFYKKHVTDQVPAPNSDLIHAAGFYFGNNPDMTPGEIGILCGLLLKSGG
jgi:CDP-6-deoxy-D-xylo-4-hexulose-3-dehydrase